MVYRGRRIKEKYRSVLEPIYYSILRAISRKNEFVAARMALLRDIALSIEGKTYKPERSEDVEFVKKIAGKARNLISRHAQEASAVTSNKLEQEIARLSIGSELRQELTLQLLYVASRRSIDTKTQIFKCGLIGLAAIIAWQMLKHCQKVEDVAEQAKASAQEKAEAAAIAHAAAWKKQEADKK